MTHQLYQLHGSCRSLAIPSTTRRKKRRLSIPKRTQSTYSSAEFSRVTPVSHRVRHATAMQGRWIPSSRLIPSYRRTQWSCLRASSQTSQITFLHVRSYGLQTSPMISSQFEFFTVASLLVGVGCRKKESHSY